MELLAPAGNYDALMAAIAHGADAVYLGYTAFGARSYAGNFDADGLKQAIETCHVRGRKVYVTVNTLVKQREMADVYDVLALLNDARADAAIVQDVGVAAMAKRCFPDLPLHASTQMALHNAQGARFAKQLGLERIVAARECPADELVKMAATGIEVEAFVHGALCVSVSGQCLFSSMVGGRSGNRGKCAQPCRLPYQMDDKQGYLLSTRDLMLLDELPALHAAGVSALKIEGRMKRPEYVAVVVAAYRAALDALNAGQPYRTTEAAKQAIRQVFHRGGFTRGYALGENHAALMHSERPNHGGLYMGKIMSAYGPLAKMRAELPLHDGDGLQVRGKADLDFVYAGPELAVGEIATMRVPEGVRAGDSVYRLTDAAQSKAAQASTTEGGARVPVDAELTACVGQPAELALTDGMHRVTVYAVEPTQAAQQRALDQASAHAQIAKMGGTPFALERFGFSGEGAFLPVSALNALRRDAVAALEAARIERPARRMLPLELPKLDRPLDTPRLIARTPNLHHAQALLAAGADLVHWLPDDYRTEALDAAIADSDTPVWFVLPQMAFSEALDALAAWVRAHTPQLSGVVLANPGQCTLDFGALPTLADAPMHAWNSWAARVWQEQGCVGLTLPPELNAAELTELTAQGGAWTLPAYGRAQLMLLAHCPRLAARGQTAQAGCDLCGQGMPLSPMTDRKGYTFPLRRVRLPHGCLVRLYNALPTWLLKDKHLSRVAVLGANIRLDFIDEPPEACARIVRIARAAMNGEQADDIADTTAGHFARGVE